MLPGRAAQTPHGSTTMGMRLQTSLPTLYLPQPPRESSHLDTSPSMSCTVGPTAHEPALEHACLSQCAQQQEGSSPQPDSNSISSPGGPHICCPASLDITAETAVESQIGGSTEGSQSREGPELGWSLHTISVAPETLQQPWSLVGRALGGMWVSHQVLSITCLWVGYNHP